MKRKPNFLKWLIIAVVVLLVIALVGKRMGWVGGEDKQEVVVEQVTKRNITEVVSASGKIQPEVQVKISPDVSGEIVELSAFRVTAGFAASLAAAAEVKQSLTGVAEVITAEDIGKLLK